MDWIMCFLGFVFGLGWTFFFVGHAIRDGFRSGVRISRHLPPHCAEEYCWSFYKKHLIKGGKHLWP
jgi:hypothetical protein